MTRLALLAVVLLSLGPRSAWPASVTLPRLPDSVRFAVIGDSGTGGKPQYRVGKQMAEYRADFPFEFVLMLGDNIYGADGPEEMKRKFELPYAPLLDSGVKFFAALGNHDDVDQRFYRPFNMNGDRFYTFRSARQSVRFFALDSNYMYSGQLRWLEGELGKAEEQWKICYFHHPLYTSGRTHGPTVALRDELEPLFVRYGVSVVFSGHEHVYERLKPQKGIYYFVSGAAGKLVEDDLRPEQGITAKGFDRGYHFMLVEIAGDDLYFQTVSDQGETLDSGKLRRPSAAASAGAAKPRLPGNRRQDGVALPPEGRHPRVHPPAPVGAGRGEQRP